MIVDMTKVALVGHRRLRHATVQLLHRRAVMHVLDITAAPELGASPLALAEDETRELESLRLLRRRMEALEQVRTRVGGHVVAEEHREPVDLRTAEQQVTQLLPEIERLAQELADLESEQGALPRHLASLRRLLPLAPGLGESESYETVALLIDRHHADALAQLRDELEDLLDRKFEMTSGVVDPDTVGALLVFPRAVSARVHDLLGSGRVSRVRLPDAYRGLSFHESVERMEERLLELPIMIDDLRADIDSRLSVGFDVTATGRQLEAQIAQLEVVSRLGGSERAFVIIGWIPTRDREALAQALADLGAELVVLDLLTHDDEEAPVLLENRPAVRPFERLVVLFGWPRAKSVDPSGLMSVFMPLFFGMMLGDMGYGAILLALSLYATWRFEKGSAARDVARVLALGATWSVVWGALYGELFGDLGERYFHMHALWLPRGDAAAIGPLLAFALAVGVTHSLLGLGLGVVRAVQKRDRHEIYERVGRVVSLCGILFLVGVVTEWLPRGLMTPSFAAIVVGMVLIGATKGMLGLLMGPLEVISGVGNVLSYLRIAAIGLASVYLARVANELAATAPAVVGAIVAILLHTLNLALGAFSPTIQALRLHYVEFFGKFFDEGGTPYRPFGADAAL